MTIVDCLRSAARDPSAFCVLAVPLTEYPKTPEVAASGLTEAAAEDKARELAGFVADDYLGSRQSSKEPLKDSRRRY